MRFLLGYGSCGIASGANDVLEGLESAFKGTEYVVEKVGCNGLCFAEPIVEVIKDNGESVLFGRLNKESAVALAESAKSGTLTESNRLTEDELEFLNGQKRVVLSGCGKVNPESIESYMEFGGYKALKKSLEMGSEKIIEEIKISGLRGRGGAGFPTHIKWQSAKNSPGTEKYIVCNADEGDPGAFMDRAVLEGDPHRVLEGMMIAGIAIGAETGIIYVRAEYPLAVKRLKIAIAQMHEKGILGENIFGSGFNFDFRIMMGAGAFVCGEETALLASLGGNRGMPVTKPPFPAQKGFRKKPTNINNVETFANVSWIIENGGSAFAEMGTEESKGTKVFALAGKVKRGGLVEVPMGLTINDIVFGICGGIKNDKDIKAVQMGGPSGGCIPKNMLDTTIDYMNIAKTGAIMGSGGMIVMDEDTCMVDMAKFFMDFTSKESCGKCVPCRIGTTRMLEILKRIVDGEGAESDIDTLIELGESIKTGALCGLGNSAPNPVLTTIKYFRDEYEAHINEKRCPAKKCTSLIEYQIDAEKCKGCSLCSKKCPVGAISGVVKSPFSIDAEKCVRCGQCLDNCKFGAIEVISGGVK
ncbi:MAG: NADH-quinone oxidoreductase subunit NuoF [Oscillospiraceae bacterium]|nr:NADH-quinone oxidoreductase subunit NuoF [Oscillospiraceae bacterium]